MLPTLISDDPEVMRQAIVTTCDAIAQAVPGIPGLHLEGPYLASSRKGTHDAGKFRVPDDAEFELVASLGNGITVMALAPECVSGDTIRGLAARGVLLCAGHTAGSYEQIRAGLDAGIRGCTH